MIIYIAGPMTGIKDYNRSKFMLAADYLRERGYEVRNPACLDHDWTKYEDYIEVGLTMLRQCDAIVLLPMWENSNGVRVEITEAKKQGLVFFTELLDPIIDQLQPWKM